MSETKDFIAPVRNYCDDTMTFVERLTLLLMVILFLCSAANGDFNNTKSRKPCRGADTSASHSHGDSADSRYQMYVKQYSNCTHVDGNLAIVFLDQADNYDMGFLKDIEEVTGFVYILANHFSYLNLTSLRVIRGQTLYSHQSNASEKYSLFVINNFKSNSKTIGLKELGLISLNEIMAGSVYFYNNDLLCFEITINWNDILTGKGAEIVYGKSNSTYQKKCGQCHPSCSNDGDLHCWGEGPDMCQKLTWVVCSTQCKSRCYGLHPNDCCRSECAGGCTGPSKTDCFSCRNFQDEGECVDNCPPLYNYENFKLVANPKAKHAYGNNCVKDCPAHLYADKGACVSECGEGHMSVNRVCVQCSGPCPKSCSGTGNDFLHAGNINNFTGCTVINGNLKILETTFKGDAHFNITGITVDQLSVFETVQEITEFLIVHAHHESFQSLSFLRNLVKIRGTNTNRVSGIAVNIFGTSLRYLGLSSLKDIEYGRALIANNTNLCYVNSVNWTQLFTSQDKPSNQFRVRFNGNDSICEMEGNVCSDQCSSSGCWGSGDDQCLECAEYKLDKSCVSSCESRVGWFTINDTKECVKCDNECLGSCFGTGADQCDACKNAKDGPYCMASCHSFKYPDVIGSCQMCHENCHGGCTGPDNTVGPGACNGCSVVVYDGQPLQAVKCLRPESECEVGFYKQYISNSVSANSKTDRHQACFRCDSECNVCTGHDLSFCDISSCVNLLEGKRCVSECSSDYYADRTKRECFKCDSQCLRCIGPTSSNCVTCRELKVYNDITKRDSDPTFNCTDTCPVWIPAHVTDVFNGVRDTICVTDAYADTILGQSKSKQIGIIVGVIVGIIIVGLVIIGIVYLVRQTVRSEENKLRLTAKFSGFDECEPLNPSEAKPDMSTMRLIKESELQKENIIGSGAFGTVYKGAWIPNGENVKIPVAIKVLQEGTSPSQSKELLEEARIMASVVHPCCVRILAVCMTAQMMLITQLMPLGCLLDYVRKNQKNIGSKVLLNWSTQIARGMKYLEDSGIVHRDLAARNVLVNSPNQVKITDFGLSKLLDYKQEQFQAKGGKMPIKWLALECIQHRIFTHKSDVWSYGVTMWELYTYGQKPYENIPAREIPDLLEKGERLPQPPICTIDVYMIMIKCWMLDADGRPSFHELVEEFAKMARDPGRFLLIPGDKLMKLPNQTYNTKDLLTSAEGPEQIISAEEYLEPQSLNQTSTDHKKPFTSERNSSPPNSPKRDTKYSGLESASNRKHRKHKNSRYSSDPCKIIGPTDERDDKMSEDEDVHDGSAKNRPSDLDVQVKLPVDEVKPPVDEDDYLQPNISSPSTYIEVLESADESEAKGSNLNSSSGPKSRLPAKDIVSNPEYFEDSKGSKRQPELQPLKLRNLSSGSEAEYYNESNGLNFKKAGDIDTRPFNESEV